MISATATAPDLTRAGTMTPRGAPATYFPSGQRSFARVIPADDTHGAAAAVPPTTCACAGSSSSTTASPTAAPSRMSSTAPRPACRWDWSAAPNGTGPPAARLIRRINRAEPDGVFISVQAFDANGGRLVRALRRTLGPDVVLIGIDGNSNPSACCARAPAARPPACT